jgi:hypothetical protein
MDRCSPPFFVCGDTCVSPWEGSCPDEVNAEEDCRESCAGLEDLWGYEGCLDACEEQDNLSSDDVNRASSTSPQTQGKKLSQ